MNKRQLLLTGAVLGFLSVAIGALGAHALKPRLEVFGRVDTFELAVRYQFFHALAFLFAGIWIQNGKWIGGYGWLSGVILFSGSLYILALLNTTALPVVLATPAGGVLMLSGWASLIYTLIKQRNS